MVNRVSSVLYTTMNEPSFSFKKIDIMQFLNCKVNDLIFTVTQFAGMGNSDNRSTRGTLWPI